jgi:hypothetical protein
MNFQVSDEQKDIRRAPRDFKEGEVKDFTQECNIREESPMSPLLNSLGRYR